jgi:hypothetical protein
MIRSRSIPTVLSRATGEGIHAILLVDADGELLGSYGTPPPSHEPDNAAGNSTAPSTGRKDWPLDAASIGALISEVAGDYKRLGEELVLLDPQNDRRSSEKERLEEEERQQKMMMQREGSSGDDGGKEGVSSAVGKGGKDKGRLDSGVNMKSLVIELEHVSYMFCLRNHELLCVTWILTKNCFCGSSYSQLNHCRESALCVSINYTKN